VGRDLQHRHGQSEACQLHYRNNAATYAYGNGGGLRTSGSTSTISNCIFWNNSDKTGVTQAGRSTHNHGGQLLVCAGLDRIAGRHGNTGTDPQMPDPDGPDNTIGTVDDDLGLLASSPCADAGDNNAVPADALDLDGDGNIAEPIPFDLLGNARFTDTFGADTGSGTPPIVDMVPMKGVCRPSC